MSERRLALVTGAAGGIGLAVAERLTRAGYVVLAAERDDDLAAQAVAALPAGAAIPVACDLADRAAVSALCARVEGEWAAGLEVMVLNAGVIIPGDVVDQTTQGLRLQVDLMLSAVIELAAAGARVMTPRGRGHLIATVSMGAILALPGSATYSAAKAGLRAFLAGLSNELRGSGVHVSGIYPSAVDTPMLLHEATHDGSLLNFVGTVSTVSDVADTVDRALRRRRLEHYVLYSDSLLCRTLQFLPWLVPVLIKPAEAIGRRGRDRYLASKGITLQRA